MWSKPRNIWIACRKVFLRTSACISDKKNILDGMKGFRIYILIDENCIVVYQKQLDPEDSDSESASPSLRKRSKTFVGLV